MNEVPGEGRDATGTGRANGPNREEPPEGLGSASPPSPAERKGFSPESTRLGHTKVVNSEIAVIVEDDRGRGALLDELQSSADARRVVPSKRPATLWSASSGGPAASGAGRAPATGGSQTGGGAAAEAVRVRCGAVRNLPYAKSTVAPTVHGGLKPSTPIRGGAA